MNRAFFIRALIGLLFIYSSIPKIRDPIGFAISIENYRILPVFLIKPASFFLSYFMFLLGIWLISPFYPQIAIAFAQFLLILFIIALFSTIIRGIDIECGCFKGAKFKAKAMLVLDVLLFSLLLLANKRKFKEWLYILLTKLNKVFTILKNG